MEETITYDGKIDVDPRFNKSEIERVNAFTRMTPIADHPETPAPRGIARFHGMVVGHRRVARELFIIAVRDNAVTEKESWPELAQSLDFEGVAPRTPTATVTDLASRRAQR